MSFGESLSMGFRTANGPKSAFPAPPPPPPVVEPLFVIPMLTE